MYGVIANVISDPVLRIGARVWLLHCNGDAERPVVMGLSKGGRRIRKFIAYKRLTNFRAAWMPEQVREHAQEQWKFDNRTEAEDLASGLTARASADTDHPTHHSW